MNAFHLIKFQFEFLHIFRGEWNSVFWVSRNNDNLAKYTTICEIYSWELDFGFFKIF